MKSLILLVPDHMRVGWGQIVDFWRDVSFGIVFLLTGGLVRKWKNNGNWPSSAYTESTKTVVVYISSLFKVPLKQAVNVSRRGSLFDRSEAILHPVISGGRTRQHLWFSTKVKCKISHYPMQCYKCSVYNRRLAISTITPPPKIKCAVSLILEK